MILSRRWAPRIWVLSAFLILISRSYEWGVSLDPALYNSIARTLARGGHFWSLSASKNLFPQFFEHPFLAMWLQSLVFRIFEPNDYSAKLLGIILGCGTFYYLFLIAEILVDEIFANVFSFVCLLSAHFIGRMPTLYLEVPLTFFFFASFYYFLKFQSSESHRDALLSGTLFGLAILSKGAAAAPLFLILLIFGAYQKRIHCIKIPAFYTWVLMICLVPASFLVMQAYWGEYSFWRLYLNRHGLGEVAQTSWARFSRTQFLYKFIETHPLHLFLAMLAPLQLFWRRELWVQVKDVGLLGVLGTSVLLISNGSLGQTNLHYFYSIYPFANLLTAVALYSFALKFYTLSWPKLGLGIALVYLVFWHILPVSMRKKGDSDFFQFMGLMKGFQSKGISEIDAVEIGSGDWMYRELSLWYWETDSRIVTRIDELKAKVVISKHGQPINPEIEKQGYIFCSGGKKYILYAAKEFQALCRETGISSSILK